MSTRASGTFEVTAERQPPYDTTDGLMLGRTSIEKRFAGELDGTSHVEMLAAGTPTKGSAAYVALERVTGTVAGKTGSFALTHVGVMNRGTPSLAIAVVPDSGTGALAGLSGHMHIDIRDGKHYYTFDYDLPG